MATLLEANLHTGAPPAYSASKHRPLGVCLVVGIFTTVALAGLLATGAFNAFSGVGQLARAPMPGTVSVSAGRADELVIYYEGDVPPSLNQLGLRVSGPDGATLATKPYSLDLRYGIDNRVGTAVASFVAPAAGHYLVSGRAADFGGRLAVGCDLGTGMMLADLASLGVGLALLAVIAAVVALVLRRLKGCSRRRHPDDVLGGGFRRATSPLSFAD
jgi:hypothetical protein